MSSKERVFEPDEIDKRILAFLFVTTQPIWRDAIVKHSGLEFDQEADYHLTNLIRNNYIREPPLPPALLQAEQEQVGFTLTTKGQEFVLHNNLHKTETIPSESEIFSGIDLISTGEDDETAGFLDYWVQGEEAAQIFSKIIEDFTSLQDAFNTKLNQHTANISEASKNPGSGAATKYHKLTLLAASDINDFCRKAEDLSPVLEACIEQMFSGYLGVIELINYDSKEEKEAGYKLIDTITEMRKTISGASDGATSWRDSVIGLIRLNMSKDLNRATNRQVRAIDRLITNFGKVDSFCERILDVLDKKLKR